MLISGFQLRVMTDLVREATHDDAVAGQLAHIDAAQFPNLGRDTVLLHQWFLRQRATVVHLT